MKHIRTYAAGLALILCGHLELGFSQPTVSGRVLNDATGFGVVGIDLDVFDAAGKSVTVTGGISRSDGQYTMVLPAPGSYTIRADPKVDDFFVDQYFNQVFLRSQATVIAVADNATISNIDFRLRPGFQIRGFVQSQGAVLPNIDLDLYHSSGEFLSGYPATTAADGSFVLGALPPGTYLLKADPDPAKGQFFVQSFYNGALELAGATPIVITSSDATGINLDLLPGGTVSGRVVDKVSGAGLPDLDLDLFDTNGLRQPFTVQTDAAGNYVLGPMPAGAYLIRADPTLAQGYARAYFPDTPFITQATPVTVVSGKATEAVDFVLTKAGSISGTITAAGSGLPVGSIDLDIFDSSTNRLDVTAKSDVSGAYTLGPLRPGSYFLRAQPGPTQGRQLQYYAGRPDINGATAVVVQAGGNTPNIDFQLEPAGWIEGLVQNASGLPLAGVDLDVFESPAGTRLTKGGRTDAFGKYVVGPLPPGQYKLRCDPTAQQGFAIEYYADKAARPSADAVTVTASSGTTGVNFVLDQGGSLAGRVTDAVSGAPVAGMDIDVLEAGSLAQLDQSGTTDADGRFLVGEVPPGNYLLRADPLATQQYMRTYHPGTDLPAAATVVAMSTGGNVTALDIRVLVKPPPPPITVSANATCQTPAPDLATGATADGNCGIVSGASQSPPAGTLLGSGSHTITLTGMDNAGNAVTCARMLIVVDVTPPTVNCPAPASASADGTCQAPIPNVLAGVTVTDNCDAALTITQSPVAGTLVGLGTHTITVTATDDAGNSSSCTTSFNVADTTPPTVSCPAPVSASADDTCQAPIPNVLASVTVTDNCDASLTLTQSPAAGTLVGLGTHTITVTATDDAGNSSSCTTSFSVADTTPPTVSCPAPASASADGTCQAPIPNALTGVTVTDNCDASLTLTQSPVAGTLVGLGTHTITVTATDDAGNSSGCTTSFNVADTAPPTVSCPAPASASADGTCQAPIPNVLAGVTVTDNCDAALTLTQSPAAGTRVGLGTHTITVTATDDAGTSSSCTTSFNVTDTAPPTVSCPAPASVSADGTCQAPIPNVLAGVTVTDNCDASLTLTQSPVAGTLVGLGTHTITVTATDDAGNSSGCTTSFTVLGDPGSSSSCGLAAVNILLKGVSTVQMSFVTTASANYQVVASDRLIGATWIPIGSPLKGTGGLVTVEFPVEGGCRFFRVATQ